MCATCGCSGKDAQLNAFAPGQKPVSIQNLTLNLNTILMAENIPSVPVTPTQEPSKTLLEVERDVLDKNNRLAERNRGFFEAKHIVAFNLVSAPGSGKTSILERTLAERGNSVPFYVIEGDQQTARDAERIAASGTPVIQVNTGKGCHLEASMVNQAIRQLEPAENSIVFIENVGNLVCPSMFDLGENKRIVVISVTEGEDKPLKYPDMFRTSDLCLINKIDLLPHLKFDLNALKTYATQINPNLQFIELSASTGAGMEEWYAWLETEQLEHYNIGPIV
ncbi:MAG: hydrogenase nickel incorporation protein HypB [Saprospiraceae bacterium]